MSEPNISAPKLRLDALKLKLTVRDGQPGYKANVEDLKAEIARLEAEIAQAEA